MAAFTVTGSLGGVPISINTNTALQTALAQQILSASTAAGLVSTGGAVALSQVNTVVTGVGTTVTALPTETAASVVLDGQFDIFVSGSTNPPTAGTAIVVAADNSNSAIVNNNPLGGLIAQTGAGGNVLLGLAGQNNFFTGVGGQDIVFLDGAVNTLTTRGADDVFVGGPSTVTAAATGLDSINMTTGTNLAFINQTTLPGAVDSIAGAANNAIVVAGTGSTSISSGAGPEAFYIDTGAGNVTLNGNLQTNDALTFIKDAATTPGTANITVNNFAGSAVNVLGYSGAAFTVGAAASGVGSTLALTDGSHVTFTNLTVAQLTAITKT